MGRDTIYGEMNNVQGPSKEVENLLRPQMKMETTESHHRLLSVSYYVFIKGIQIGLKIYI